MMYVDVSIWVVRASMANDCGITCESRLDGTLRPRFEGVFFCAIPRLPSHHHLTPLAIVIIVTGRRMAVLDPVKVVIVNVDDNFSVDVECANKPGDDSLGVYVVPLTKTFYIQSKVRSCVCVVLCVCCACACVVLCVCCVCVCVCVCGPRVPCVYLGRSRRHRSQEITLGKTPIRSHPIPTTGLPQHRSRRRGLP